MRLGGLQDRVGMCLGQDFTENDDFTIWHSATMTLDEHLERRCLPSVGEHDTDLGLSQKRPSDDSTDLGILAGEGEALGTVGQHIDAEHVPNLRETLGKRTLSSPVSTDNKQMGLLALSSLLELNWVSINHHLADFGVGDDLGKHSGCESSSSYLLVNSLKYVVSVLQSPNHRRGLSVLTLSILDGQFSD